MALRGFEPPTPRLRVWCSNQAELQDHLSVNIEKKFHLKKFVYWSLTLSSKEARFISVSTNS